MRELLGTLLILGFGGFVVGAAMTLTVQVMTRHEPWVVGIFIAAGVVLFELASETYERLRKRL